MLILAARNMSDLPDMSQRAFYRLLGLEIHETGFKVEE